MSESCRVMCSFLRCWKIVVRLDCIDSSSLKSGAVWLLQGAEATREVARSDLSDHPLVVGVPLQEAFSMADEILRQGITGISDIVVKPGLINVDFADVRSVMMDAGPALMGIGRGTLQISPSKLAPARAHLALVSRLRQDACTRCGVGSGLISLA